MSAGTLSVKNYAKLLSKALPQVIHNDRQLEHFTELLLELDDLGRPTPEEAELAELLATLIEKYEAEKFPLRRATPVELMQFLLEQQGISAKDLIPVLGSKGTVSDILSGKRNIGVSTAAKLGEFFHVAPELFIDWSAARAARV